MPIGHTQGDKLLFYETCVALGGIIGNIVFLFLLFCAECGIVCFCVFCVRGGTSSVWDFCRDFCRMLVDGACGDIKCFSDLYAPRANRQIRVCFCDRRSHRKRIGSRIVFLKRLVEDERQGGISTGKLS